MVYNFASLQAVFTNMIQGVILGEITDINAAVTEAAEGIKAIQ
jgi:multiple sugar transport system substrate-binding protein